MCLDLGKTKEEKETNRRKPIRRKMGVGSAGKERGAIPRERIVKMKYILLIEGTMSTYKAK